MVSLGSRTRLLRPCPQQVFRCALGAILLFFGFSGPALAQGMVKYVNRDLQFTISLPHVPEESIGIYEAADGARLSAHVFTAADGTAEYRLTVVEFANHPSSGRLATAHAAETLAARGEAEHNPYAYIDGLAGHHLSVVEPDGRRRISAIYFWDNRLYISEGSDLVDAPLVSPFTHSIIITHPDGTQLNLDGYNAESFNAFECR